MSAIMQHESNGGKNCGAGRSGERGCLQYLPDTWIAFAKEVLGYIPPQSPINEQYVASVMIQKWLNRGHDVDDVARIWNQGNAGPCVTGVNSYNVEYNSCDYQRAVLAYYHR